MPEMIPLDLSPKLSRPSHIRSRSSATIPPIGRPRRSPALAAPMPNPTTSPANRPIRVARFIDIPFPGRTHGARSLVDQRGPTRTTRHTTPRTTSAGVFGTGCHCVNTAVEADYLPSSWRVRSSRIGTPLRPVRSCAYKPIPYATPPPLMPSSVRSMWSKVSVLLW